MERSWDPFGLWVKICVGLISLCGTRECWSLNDEGLTLLEFRARITSDPYGALVNWNPNDCDPCKWFGVHCVDGVVQMLDLNGLSLEGALAPELGKLSYLKSLVLCKNDFYGTIPKELGDLGKLELLDLSENNLNGSIPVEISIMSSLKQLLVYENKIEEIDSQELGKFRLPSKLLFVNSVSSTLFSCKNRKFAYGHATNTVLHRDFKQLSKGDSAVIPIKGALTKYLNALVLPFFKLRKASLHDDEEIYYGSEEPEFGQNVISLVDSAHRMLLDQSSNLAAAPISSGTDIEISSLPTILSSGGFPAVPDSNKKQNQSPVAPSNSPHDTPPQQHSSDGASGKPWNWKYLVIILIVIILVTVLLIMLFIWRKRAAKVMKPWKTGISGQLQKAFVTGVPKLNRDELETACEDFSNIIVSYNDFTIYKGTLSSGVEISVVSTAITSAADWSKNMETSYRKKLDVLSRVNHKNFVNLIGYCDEEEPFTRMMVFEYAPNGSLFERLHDKDVEHLDWSARMRIVMGTAYCLQYMHHDVKPAVSHTNLNSCYVLLSDDNAAKIGETTFGQNALTPANRTGDPSKKTELPPDCSPETDVYNFGILLLETISGKLPNSEEQGRLENWAAEYLNDKGRIKDMIDPTLQSFKDNELEVMCEVIKECIQPDATLRPTMKDIAPKLREVLRISPEQSVPRLSPLWWAELEILSGEAT